MSGLLRVNGAGPGPDVIVECGEGGENILRRGPRDQAPPWATLRTQAPRKRESNKGPLAVAAALVIGAASVIGWQIHDKRTELQFLGKQVDDAAAMVKGAAEVLTQDESDKDPVARFIRERREEQTAKARAENPLRSPM